VTRGPDRAVIVAGGGGTRLWPWTGPGLPKPLLPLGGAGRTLLAAGLDRLAGLVPPSAISLQAPAALGARLAAAEPRLARGSVRDEPSARDTGPAIALAMRRLLADAPDAVVAVLPADQRVADEAAFRAALTAAAEAPDQSPGSAAAAARRPATTRNAARASGPARVIHLDRARPPRGASASAAQAVRSAGPSSRGPGPRRGATAAARAPATATTAASVQPRQRRVRRPSRSTSPA
jgi:hypothetical protein